MRDPENIRAVDGLSVVDWMGFIYHPASPRHIDAPPGYLPQQAKRVGVFVNQPLDLVATQVKAFGHHLVQLHGHETPEYCRQLIRAIGRPVQLIKAIQAGKAADLKNASAYEGIAHYLLFETPCHTYGGSGHHFDWDILSSYSGHTPFLLAGGIAPVDIELVRSFTHPLWVGIDLNSGFETAPGYKDPQLIQSFVNKLKQP